MNSFRLIVYGAAVSLGFLLFPSAGVCNYVIHAPGISIDLSQDGEITGAFLGDKKVEWKMQGQTDLAGCRVEGPVESHKINDGGVWFKKKLECQTGRLQKQAQIVERFLPTKNSVRWEMELNGEGSPWSTAIETRLHFQNPEAKQFWTAWGDPKPQEMRNPVSAVQSQWTDPLILPPFYNRNFWYGAPYYRYDQPWGSGPKAFSDVFCIPLATVVQRKDDTGLSLVLSPEDVLLDMTLETSENGDVTFSRLFRRISPRSPVRYSMDLISQEADWRGGLRWATERYPDFFNPPLASANNLAGTAAYSTYENVLDGGKLRRMAFRVNWKASFDFPYQGMFLPPVADDQPWSRGYPFAQEPPDWLGADTSIAQMAAYSHSMRAAGFYVLNYYNLWEFGKHIVYPPPQRKRNPSDPDFWRDPNDFLYAKLADALVFPPRKQLNTGASFTGTLGEGGPLTAGFHDVVLDPGEASWQNFLLGQARRLIEKIPDSSGIALDRLDWLRFYNFQRDDGVSWYDGPARSLVSSWKDLFSKLGPLEHSAGQVVFVNDANDTRLDVLRQIDGLFDENGKYDSHKNLSALLGIFKPTISWVETSEDLNPDPDAFFQRLLYLGIFPFAPFPRNDHSIQPNISVEKLYMDYGPLLDSMRGKKWVLLPRVVSVKDEAAIVNMFQVPAGYVIPITFGGGDQNVAVIIRDVSKLFSSPAAIHCEVIHPGESHWQSCKLDRNGDTMTVAIPLLRRCAVVRLRID